VYVAASSQCFADLPFSEACQQLTELEYDRVEIWLDAAGKHLSAAQVAADPEAFLKTYREVTRLTPVAFDLEQDVPIEVFEGICRVAKFMRVTQITIPSAELGTPFNEEVDRLRKRLLLANQSGLRLSLTTRIGQLTEDPRTAVELCQAIQGLGLTLDVSHYLVGPHAGQSHDSVFPYVYHMHLRDTSPTELQVPVGLGEVDYGRLVAMLRRYDYQRALSVNILPHLLKGSDRALEMRKLRMLLETLL
jgi:sugar phosphate isomerase/epimerase